MRAPDSLSRFARSAALGGDSLVTVGCCIGTAHSARTTSSTHCRGHFQADEFTGKCMHTVNTGGMAVSPFTLPCSIAGAAGQPHAQTCLHLSLFQVKTHPKVQVVRAGGGALHTGEGDAEKRQHGGREAEAGRGHVLRLSVRATSSSAA